MIPNEMMFTVLISSVLVFYTFVGYALEDVYVITRNSGPKDQVRNGKDSFTIPRSKCDPLTASTGDECELFRADPPRNLPGCCCACPSGRPTFAFLKNQSACFDNREIRVLQDCNHTSNFLNEPTNPPIELWTLRTSVSVSTNIPNNGLQSCEVFPNSSWYLGCNGTRVKSPLYQRKMKDLFALTNHFGDVVFNHVSLEVRGGILNAHLLEGKIINLAIRCNLSNSNAQFHSCLMFKLTGQQICPEPEPKLYTRTIRSPGTKNRNGNMSPNPVNTSSSPGNVHSRPSPGHEDILEGRRIIGVIPAIIVSIAFLIATTLSLLLYRHPQPSKNQERDNNLFEVTITSRQISQSFSEETDTGYMMMEGASCPERPCEYAYANAVEITPLSLISRSTRTGCAPADGSANQQSPAAVEVSRSPAIYIVKNYEDTNNINAKNSLFTKGTISSPISQSCPEKPENEYMTMDEFRSPALYTVKDYENAEKTHVKNGLSDQGANEDRLQVDCGASALSYENFPGSSSGHFSEETNDPEEYVEMGKTRGVQFADSEDKCGRNALSKEKEGPGNPFVVEIEKFRPSTTSPDKHHDNTSAKNISSNEGENDERLKLDCKACVFSYAENFSGSSSKHFSADRTDPEEYVEMGKRRGVQFADSADKYSRNSLSKGKEGPGNPFVVEIEKFRSSTISPDKHYENISAKNNSSNEGENDGRLRLDCRACGLSYKNVPGSSTSHSSAKRTDPEEYVEMGKTRGVQFADSEDEYGRNALPKEKEGPGNPFLVEIEKFTSSTDSSDKHNENISKACGFSYENFSASSSGHFSAERTDPGEYVEMGKKRGMRFADSEDKNGHNGLSKEEEGGPGNLVLLETEKLRLSANSPDKHYENISAKNDGENDERLRLDRTACGLSYENLPGSSTSHFSAERTDPVEYVEMGKRRSVQLADSSVQPGLHGFPGLTEEEGREYLMLNGSGN